MDDTSSTPLGLPANSQYTAEQVAELKKVRAARLKLLNVVVAVLAVAIFGFTFYLKFRDLSPMKVLGISFPTLVIACMASSTLLYVAFVYFGRCPGCNRMSWSKSDKSVCSNCGLDLG